MNKENIIKLLGKHNKSDVEKYVSYVSSISPEKNAWVKYITDEKFAEYFERVAKEGLVFDGKHITLQSTGICYDYIAYKNKMLIAYPDTIFDIQLVYKDDTFSFKKENGVVVYNHEIKSPFNNSDNDIVGCYCVIKNKRGEFVTTMGKDEIQKHRTIAKTDFIWKSWYKEMTLKTVIKKAIKFHFDDIYSDIEEEDNYNYNLSLLDCDLDVKQEIENIDNLEVLKEFYLKNKGKYKDFDILVTNRKKELIDNK